MTDKKTVWIDPGDCGLVTVEAAEQKRRQEAERRQKEEMERRQAEAERQRRKEAEQKRRKEQAMKREEEKQNAAKTQALTTQPKPEILPPASKTPTLSPPDACTVPGLDLTEFERQIKMAAKMLNLAEPEGLLDRMIGRPDHRIDVKTERARRLAALITACSAIVEAARTLRGAQHQMYLDHLVFQLQVAEAQQNLEAVAANARLQRQLEEAKAEAEVEKYKRQVRESQHPPQPPPPPPPPPAAPNVDENEVKRQTAQKVRKLESDLKLDAVEAEMDHQDKLAATALARIQKIFAEPQTLRSAKRSRILNLRDNYGIDDSLLPAGVLELLEEE